MGLFDFLKKKPAEAAAADAVPATPAPAADPEAQKPAGGPRYQRPAFATDLEAAAAVNSAINPAIPPMPPLEDMPPMPQMPPFEPSNNLEQVLLLAAQDPSYRLAFYHELLQAELLMLTVQPEGTPAGEVTIEEGTEVQLQMLHDGRIPIFSSEGRIYDGGALPEGVHFLRVRGEAFFQMTRGAECVLNPFSGFGKLLVAPEIEDLLTGRVFAPADGQQPQVQLSQPELPAAFTQELIAFFEARPQVQVAYIAQMQVPDQQVPPRLLLAFDVEGEDMEFLQEMGPVVQAHLTGEEAIDVVRLSPDPNEPLTQYFSQQDPLFRR